MKPWKTWLNKLLYPPVWCMVLVTVMSLTAVAMVFVMGWSEHPLATIAYVPAAYSVTTVTLFCIFVLPERYRQVKQRVYEHPFGHRFVTDAVFRMRMSLYGSLGINLLYAGCKAILGVCYQTVWFLVFAVYYAILALMRFLLLHYVSRYGIGSRPQGELKRSRLCAGILLFVNPVLSVAVLMMIRFDRGFEYPGMLIYVMAAYTFYVTTMAIVNLVKYRKYHSAVMSMAKVVNLASALFSMLALETAMLAQFGGESSPEFRTAMLIATGAGISVIVVVLSVFVIAQTTGQLGRQKKEGGSV